MRFLASSAFSRDDSRKGPRAASRLATDRGRHLTDSRRGIHDAFRVLVMLRHRSSRSAACRRDDPACGGSRAAAGRRPCGGARGPGSAHRRRSPHHCLPQGAARARRTRSRKRMRVAASGLVLRRRGRRSRGCRRSGCRHRREQHEDLRQRVVASVHAASPGSATYWPRNSQAAAVSMR
jgi:hypothetical protein